MVYFIIVYFKTGCCWGYLKLRGMKQWEAEENYIMRNFIICIPHQVLLG
jgi:hypothetical protein